VPPDVVAVVAGVEVPVELPLVELLLLPPMMLKLVRWSRREAYTEDVIICGCTPMWNRSDSMLSVDKLTEDESEGSAEEIA